MFWLKQNKTTKEAGTAGREEILKVVLPYTNPEIGIDFQDLYILQAT